MRKIPAPFTDLASAVLSDDGSMILAMTAACFVVNEIWDASTGEGRHTLYGHDLWTNSAQFSANGLTVGTDNVNDNVQQNIGTHQQVTASQHYVDTAILLGLPNSQLMAHLPSHVLPT